MRSSRLARFQQFRWKLAATFIILAAPPLAAAALYVFFVVPGDLEQEAVESLRVQHRAGTDLVNGYLAGAEEDARVLARVPTILALASDADSIPARRAVESHFRIVLEEHENYLQLRYLDAGGHEVVRVDREPGGARVLAASELQDKSQRYYVTAAVELPPGEVYVSPIDLNREHGAIEQPYVPVVRFAAQVRAGDGALSGLVVINVAAAGLLESLLAGRGAAAPGGLMLVDEDGYFILHTDPGRSWSGPRDLDTGWNYFDQVPELAAPPSVSAEGPGADVYPGGLELEAAGSQIVAGYVGPPSADERWLLVATAPRSEILAPANRLRLTLLAVFAIMALAGLAVIWFAAGRLAGPARSLREGAARIGSGDFEHRIDLASSDELGEVADAFNSMAAELRDSYSVLERRVADRTRDLEERDEKLRALGEMGIGLVQELSPHAVVERASVAARRLVDAQSVELIRWEEGGHVERHVTVRDDGVAARPAETAERAGERVRIPIAAHGRALGELRIVGRADAEPFTDTDRDLLETLASHVAVALVNARLHARERESVAQLEELNRAKSDFVSAVSHQLQSPVAAVRGYADILRSHGGELPVQQRERMIDEIAEQALNLGELVDDILRVSRIDAGGLDVVLRPCLLEPVVVEAARDAEDVKLATRIRLHRPDRPLVVIADPASLKQAVLNLMDNALKYSPRGSPVDVGWRVSPERRLAVVDVWDRGPGIPPDDRERIFERFVRLPPTASRPDVPGTGLGLYIARSIVEAHGGDIRVEDGEAGGTRVALRLPLSDGEA